MISLGIVGVGKWAARYAETVRRSFPDVHISCAARRSAARPDFLPDSAELFTDWREMIRKQRMDGIVVCAHPDVHVDVAHAALSAGCPVMVEKPVALTFAETSRLNEVQGRAPLLVNHVHLFAPAFCLLKEILRGNVRAMESEGSNSGPRRGYSSLYDYGPHDVAMCLDVMERDPARISCVRTESGAGEMFDISLEFGSVTSSSRVGNGGYSRMRRLRVLDGLHNFVYDDTAADKLTFDGAPLPVSPELPLTRAISVFLGAISGRPDPRLGLGMALRVAAVLDECARQSLPA